MNVLQAMRWIAMSWNDVSEETVIKCFIKSGILNSEQESNALVVADNNIDPFAGFQSEISNVEDIAQQAERVDTIGIKETVSSSFDPPSCQELPDSWEANFFNKLGANQETVHIYDSNNDNDTNEEAGASVAALKVTSFSKAIANLEDALQFLQSRGNIIMANELSKVISRTQSDQLDRRNSQSKVTDFFTKS